MTRLYKRQWDTKRARVSNNRSSPLIRPSSSRGASAARLFSLLHLSKCYYPLMKGEIEPWFVASQRVQARNAPFNWFELARAFLTWIVTKHEAVTHQVLLDSSD